MLLPEGSAAELPATASCVTPVARKIPSTNSVETMIENGEVVKKPASNGLNMATTMKATTTALTLRKAGIYC